MRVRTFELRLIAVALSASWTLVAASVLLAYRPGGPYDLLVVLAAGLPILVAVAGLAWPPLARGGTAFAAIVWLGLGTLLVLLPSIAGVLGQLLAPGPQTLLPSGEAAYPWILALLGTSLFSGLGVARWRLGGTALRRRRLVRGTLLAVAATAAVSASFTGAAIGNELALRDRSAAGSRFGPIDPSADPPSCDRPVQAGGAARVEARLVADVDGKPIGSVDIRAVRDGDDYRSLAYVATNRELGQYGAARVGDREWLLTPGTGWRAIDATGVAALDVAVLQAAIESGTRPAAETVGISFVEGARARYCRVAIDGPAFVAAFPEARRLIGEADVEYWRGELDYWIFADGELGRVAGVVGGAATGIVEGGIQARLRATMTATERDRPHAVVPPLR